MRRDVRISREKLRISIDLMERNECLEIGGGFGGVMLSEEITGK